MRNSSFFGFQTVYKKKWGIPHFLCRKKKFSFCSKTMNKLGQWAVESPKSERLSPQNHLKYEFPQQNIHKIRKHTWFFLARLRREQSLWFHNKYLGNMRNFRWFTKTGLFFFYKKKDSVYRDLKKWGIRKPNKKVWFTDWAIELATSEMKWIDFFSFEFLVAFRLFRRSE